MLLIGTMHKTYLVVYDFKREKGTGVKVGQTTPTETHICFPSCSWSCESLFKCVCNETPQFILISSPQILSLYLVHGKKILDSYTALPIVVRRIEGIIIYHAWYFFLSQYGIIYQTWSETCYHRKSLKPTSYSQNWKWSFYRDTHRDTHTLIWAGWCF